MADKGIAEDTDSILVKGEVKIIGQGGLTLHFTNNKKCGGGEIAKILLEDNQATITFCDSSVAARVAETKVHKILGKEVTVELNKPITVQKPTTVTGHEQAAILVNNVADTISDDLLYLYIDKITELDGESGDYTITRCDSSQVKITFNTSAKLPTGGIDGIIATINRTPLKSTFFLATIPPVVVKPKPGALSLDITISNLPADNCSVKILQKYFSNKKKFGKNTYKAIKIISKTTAILQLTDEQAVQTVLSGKHTTLGKHVILTRCTASSEISAGHGMDQPTASVLSEEKLAQNTTFSIEVPKHFIMCFKNQQQQLEAQLKVYHAVMHLYKEKNEVTIIPCQGNERIKDWQSLCENVIKIYLESLKTETVSIPLDKRDLMRPLVDTTIQSEKSLNIEYVEERSLVIIAGEQNEVNRIKKMLEDAYKSIINETVPIDNKKHFLLLNVKKHELLSSHPEVKTTINSDRQSVTVLGFRDKCDKFIADVNKLKSKIKTVQVLITSVFTHFLSQQVGKDLLRYYLQEFKSEVATYFDKEGNVVILGTSGSSAAHDLAMKIQNNLCYTHVPFPVFFQKSIETVAWTTLSASLEKKHLVQISALKNEIEIIGDLQMSNLAKKEIEQIIETECWSERCFQLCDAQWRCITTQLYKKWKKLEHKLKKVRKIQLTLPSINDNEPCIIIKGDKAIITVLEKEVETFLAFVVSSPNPIKQIRRGVVRYFCSEKGRAAVGLIESQQRSCVQIDVKEHFQKPQCSKMHSCTAVLEARQSNSSVQTNMKRIRPLIVASNPSQCSKVCSGTTREGKTVTVYHGDITTLSADVLVNVTNTYLQHTGGVALAIANKGGSCIQQDSDAYLRTVTAINEGDVIVTANVGNLTCNSLIHVVCPTWRGGTADERSILSTTCCKALEVAATENFQTVLLPVIGSGKYGFPVGISAKVMIETVVKYSQTNPSASIREVAFVAFHKHEVNEFFEEMKQMFQTALVTDSETDASVSVEDYVILDEMVVTGNNSTDNIVNMQQPSTAPTNPSINNQSFDVFQNIELHKGNLLDHSADLYVNTCGSDLVLKNGAVARSFLKAGGQALQDECNAYVSQNGQIPVGGVVLTKPGAIPCLGIIHTVGTEYTGKKAEEHMLQNIVKQCLLTCESLKASCIAFPALGAGNLKFPITVVSEVMISTIADYLKSNHGTTQIKTVKLVIYDFQEFQHAFKSLQSNNSNASLVSAPVKSLMLSSTVTTAYQPHIVKTFTEGDITVEIILGDITDDDSDAIVSPTNEKMDLSAGRVSAAILKKGGPEMQMICDSVTLGRYHLKKGEIYTTTAPGNLRCNNIFHVVLSVKNLGSVISLCLEQAETNQLSSIAFPALGTDAFLYSVQSTADIMHVAIATFAKLDPVHVKTVRIVLYQQSMVSCYTDVFAQPTSSKTFANVQKINKTTELKQHRSLFDRARSVVRSPRSNTGTKVESYPDLNVPTVTRYSELTIQVFADDIKKVEKTEACIQQLIEEQLFTDKIVDKVISKLTSSQQTDIEHKAKNKNVDVTIKSGKVQNCIQLKGDLRDIVKLKQEIHAILNKMNSEEKKQKEILSVQAKVKWQWENPCDDIEDYDPEANYAIEQAYQSDKTKLYVYQNARGLREEFDFQQMKAMDLKDQSVYNIKRLSVDHTCLPSEWCSMSDDSVCHFEALDTKSKEYNEVKTLFEFSLPTPTGFKIVKIERIQNPLLYSQYIRRKKAMDSHNPKGYQNERKLFHGCPKDVTEKISYRGFNRSFAGKNATVYGRGVYFAQNASYSARNTYSPRDVNNKKYIFVVRVLTGEYALGQSNDIQPPPRHSDKDLYDSNVDNVTNPQIFVIFHDTQAYPEYLITFQ